MQFNFLNASTPCCRDLLYEHIYANKQKNNVFAFTISSPELNSKTRNIFKKIIVED